jgi:CheY-like chemotaxis protein
VVLLVEDDDHLRVLALKILKHRGYEVLLAIDGADAVTQALDSAPAPAVVLMDLGMPGMDGWEATAIIKKHKPDLPIIAVSANAMLSDRRRSQDAGFHDFITKPYRLSELIAAVAKYLPADPAGRQ